MAEILEKTVSSSSHTCAMLLLREAVCVMHTLEHVHSMQEVSTCASIRGPNSASGIKNQRCYASAVCLNEQDESNLAMQARMLARVYISW